MSGLLERTRRTGGAGLLLLWAPVCAGALARPAARGRPALLHAVVGLGQRGRRRGRRRRRRGGRDGGDDQADLPQGSGVRMTTPAMRGKRTLLGVAVLALAALGAQSCGKKESLILVSVTATPDDPMLQSLTIEAATDGAKTFTLTNG